MPPPEFEHVVLIFNIADIVDQVSQSEFRRISMIVDRTSVKPLKTSIHFRDCLRPYLWIAVATAAEAKLLVDNDWSFLRPVRDTTITTQLSVRMPWTVYIGGIDPYLSVDEVLSVFRSNDIRIGDRSAIRRIERQSGRPYSLLLPLSSRDDYERAVRQGRFDDSKKYTSFSVQAPRSRPAHNPRPRDGGRGRELADESRRVQDVPQHQSDGVRPAHRQAQHDSRPAGESPPSRARPSALQGAPKVHADSIDVQALIESVSDATFRKVEEAAERRHEAIKTQLLSELSVSLTDINTRISGVEGKVQQLRQSSSSLTEAQLAGCKPFQRLQVSFASLQAQVSQLLEQTGKPVPPPPLPAALSGLAQNGISHSMPMPAIPMPLPLSHPPPGLPAPKSVHVVGNLLQKTPDSTVPLQANAAPKAAAPASRVVVPEPLPPTMLKPEPVHTNNAPNSHHIASIEAPSCDDSSSANAEETTSDRSTHETSCTNEAAAPECISQSGAPGREAPTLRNSAKGLYDFPSTAVVAHADGACSSNGGGGSGGMGVALAYPSTPPMSVEYSGPSVEVRCFVSSQHILAPCTVNLSKLKAIHSALLRAQELLKLGKMNAYQDLIIISDSRYAMNVIDGTWKAHANTDLVAKISSAYEHAKASFHDVELRYVRGHSGDRGNDYVRALAQEAARTGDSLPEHEIFNWRLTHPNQHPVPVFARPSAKSSSVLRTSEVKDDHSMSMSEEKTGSVSSSSPASSVSGSGMAIVHHAEQSPRLDGVAAAESPSRVDEEKFMLDDPQGEADETSGAASTIFTRTRSRVRSRVHGTFDTEDNRPLSRRRR